MMKPYFDTHSAGVLLLIVLLAGLSMEAIQLARQWRWRADATSVGRRSFWLGFGACLIVTNVALYLGPSAFPAAAIRPGAAAFALGVVIMAELGIQVMKISVIAGNDGALRCYQREAPSAS
jgi:hypothetical protein